MSNLEELSDELIDIISSENDGKLDAAADFLKQHKEKATCIINTNGMKSKMTPLMNGCLNSQESIVKLLLSYEPDLNVPDKYNYEARALSYSIAKLDQESGLNIIRMFAEYGVDFDLATNHENALMFAMNASIDSDIMRYKVIELLLQLGADVNNRDRYGNTPLIIASQSYSESIPLLLKYGANVNARGCLGDTALMNCCAKLDVMMIDLIDANANIFIYNHRGYDSIYNVFHSMCLFYSFGKKFPITPVTKLARAYLESVSTYFKNSSYDRIKSDIAKFVMNPKDDSIFIIKPSHLNALGCLDFLFSDYFEPLFNDNEATKYLDYLPYFDSTDFQEKLYADVINRLDEDHAEIDGQTLRGMRARAKNVEEMRKFDEIARILNQKLTLVNKFLKVSKETIESLRNALKKLPADVVLPSFLENF